MKKLLVLFLVLSLAMVSTIAADEDEDDGIGLTVGVELGFGNVADEASPYLMPMIIYENSFLDGALDIYAEVDYTFGFTKEYSNSKLEEVFPQSLYVDLAAAYNLDLGDTSTLSFILENEFDEIYFSPESGYFGIFTPAVQFTQELDFGDLYAKIGIPVYYTDADDDTAVGLDFTVGWESTFGLGLEAIVYTLLSPDAGYEGLELTAYYETGPIYAEVVVEISNEWDYLGVTITPEVDYSFGSFTFYVNCEFGNIAAKYGNVSVSPALGVKYSF